jgi:hypothetical protein
MDISEIGWGNVDKIDLAQGKDDWNAPVDTEIKGSVCTAKK